MPLASDLAMALDAALFARAALGFHADEWQESVLRWNGKRLLLNCSRQSGKSTVCSILALHRALFVPDSLVLLVSPTLRQSGELFRKVRGFMRSVPDRPQLTEDNQLSFALPNGSRVVSLPGSEGTVRGFSGVALLIEDEASRVPDELHAALRPMLAASQGQLILASTPHGARGHFFDAWSAGGDQWERVRIPAERIPRISDDFLAEERNALGHWLYQQEYECEFVDVESQLFASADVYAALTDTVRPLWSS